MAPFFFSLVLLAMLPSPLRPDSDRTHPRVRPLDAAARQLVEDGVDASPTISQLVVDLDGTSVVVYIRTGVGLRARGLVTFVAHGGELTYLLVKVDATQPRPARLATLAHELTHAMEIAEAGDEVQDEASLVALYRRIGTVAATGNMESPRAQAIERQARREVAAIATPRK
jgi:hypothetical protein